MDTIFMNSENNKTSKPHILKLKLADKSHRDIRVVTTDKRRSILASEPNYHSTKYISKDLLIMEMRKTELKMNKLLYVGQAILDISIVIRNEKIVWKHGPNRPFFLCNLSSDNY